jgi:hypothetical protein
MQVQFVIHDGQAVVGCPRCASSQENDMSTNVNAYNDRNGGRLVIERRRNQAEWVRIWNWTWWVTLTFSRDVGRDEANAILDDFLNQLEAAFHDSLTCMIAQEQKTYSGSGKPAGRVHFHLLIGSAVNLPALAIVNWWQLTKFGGSRTSGAGADVKVYDSNRGAVNYLLKFQADPTWDLRYRNLELLSPSMPASAATCSRMRRNLQRCEERRAKAATQPAAMKGPFPPHDSEPVSLKREGAERLGCLARSTVFSALMVVNKAGIDVKVRCP